MHTGLKLFVELAETLLAEEKKNPVAKPIDTDKLYKTIALQLNDAPTLCEDFKSILLQIVKSTPKTASTSFLINFLKDELIKRHLEIY